MDDQTFLLPYLLTIIPIFAFCLILTITVELIVAKSLGVKDNHALLIVVAAQVLTNPIAVLSQVPLLMWLLTTCSIGRAS